MQSTYFDNYELSGESAFNYVTHKMVEMIEQESRTVKDFNYDYVKSSYRWIIGSKVADSIFPSKPSRIFGYDVIYEIDTKFYFNGINFETGVINTKNCSNCRFGNDGICKYINKCVKSSLEPAPSHWQEMTDAQTLEKIMPKKLIGDLSHGYSYIDTDMAARIAESKRRAEEMNIDRDALDGMMYSDSIKKALNNIYGGLDVSELYPKQIFQLPITNYTEFYDRNRRNEEMNRNDKMYNKKEDKNMNIKLYMDEGKWVGDITNPQGLIKNVIFSGPCTIVQWLDGDKTIVRCENEDFDKEKGLAMAIVKKFFGTNESKSNYNDIFKKWIKDEKEEESSDKPEVTLTANVEVDPSTVYLSIKEFAKTAGVSESTIRKQLSKGQYPYAEKVDGKWVIPINKED